MQERTEKRGVYAVAGQRQPNSDGKPRGSPCAEGTAWKRLSTMLLPHGGTAAVCRRNHRVAGRRVSTTRAIYPARTCVAPIAGRAVIRHSARHAGWRIAAAGAIYPARTRIAPIAGRSAVPHSARPSGRDHPATSGHGSGRFARTIARPTGLCRSQISGTDEQSTCRNRHRHSQVHMHVVSFLIHRESESRGASLPS